MYTRLLKPPKHSFFLFGPRSTGKSTWLRQVFKEKVLYFDFLKSKTLLPILKNPDLFSQQVLACSTNTKIIVDEIQKCPAILDEVHSLIEEHGYKHFILTGSSARKLKKMDANLLAGRSLTEYFFPLSYQEIQSIAKQQTLLEFGGLPAVVSAESDFDRIRILESYVETYIKEEIQQEAIVRNLDSFARFLEIAAGLNAQTLNATSVSRDVGIGRTTINNYYSILIDTLIGSLLPAWRPGFKVKEVDHPKFYFFDVGVVRALSGGLRDSISDMQRGYYFETSVLNELRAARHYLGVGGDFYYWSTPSGAEIDFIWKRGPHIIAFEVKASKSWKYKMGQHLHEFKSQIGKAYGIYLGKETLKDKNILVLSFSEFVSQLYQGKIFPKA